MFGLWRVRGPDVFIRKKRLFDEGHLLQVLQIHDGRRQADEGEEQEENGEDQHIAKEMGHLPARPATTDRMNVAHPGPRMGAKGHELCGWLISSEDVSLDEKGYHSCGTPYC